ncbi:aldo/keto reductase [Sediminispirochaeta bajacaliforniensis]|uniref:aldo/keto reductase n=1 Tax=Sediminispirochaeta bajacaliforniensis TaxID=148 RepID=UPI0003751D20|nr:aldo/keto reductase [Sediminispirochaeta bajacaliforniensis]
MNKHSLGKLPVLINGAWQLSAGHSPDYAEKNNQAIEAFLKLIDAGFTSFDGADIYTGVEELFGKLLSMYLSASPQHRREDLRFHTKFVPDKSILPQVDESYIRSIVERSLSRIGTDYLDLVQFHWWDWEVPGYVEAARYLMNLAKEGKIRQLGTTNFDTEHLRDLCDNGISIVSNQTQYSLLDRRPEHGMISYCLEQNIALLCYGTLAGGFLTDKWLGKRDPGYGENLENRSLIKYRLIIDEFGGWDAFQELLSLMHAIADAEQVSIANIATSWVLSRKGVKAAIVGTRNDTHVASNRKSAELRLTSDDLQKINRFIADHPGPGGEPFALERIPGGIHQKIMKMELNKE